MKTNLKKKETVKTKHENEKMFKKMKNEKT